jgi:hypothetical protein
MRSKLLAAHAAADDVRCARVRREIKFLLTFETAPFFCVWPVLIHDYIAGLLINTELI